MKNKELFKIWTLNGMGRWSRFAKPALFVHQEETLLVDGSLQPGRIPQEIIRVHDNETAVIVDLPGVASVKGGVELAKIGFQPVPLYNGIYESKIGNLENLIDYRPVVQALQLGAEVVKGLDIRTFSSPPAFMLDRNRNIKVSKVDGVYDNRWSVELEDMPGSIYLKASKIKRILLWTTGGMAEDLTPILEGYRENGIEIIIKEEKGFEDKEDLARLQEGLSGQEGLSDQQGLLGQEGLINSEIGIADQIGSLLGTNIGTADEARKARELREKVEIVRKYENARFGLLLITIMSFVNLLFMFAGFDAPLLYTAPCLMWLTYLWLSYGLANVLAVAFPIIYLVLYLSSQKKPQSFLIASTLFIVDLIIFYIYAISYGLIAFTGNALWYGLIVFGFPIYCLNLLVKGIKVRNDLNEISEVEYSTYLDHLDGIMDKDGRVVNRHIPRRRLLRGYRGLYADNTKRGYRGFGGYGGSGSGGYSGGGYSGGFGGGFGG